MNPKTTETLLSAYADGALDKPGMAEVEAMIAADPALARIVDSHRAVTALLRAACADGVYDRPAMPMMFARPRHAMPARGLSRATQARRLSWAAAAAVLLLIGFAGGLRWDAWTANAHDHLLDEVAEYHEVFQKETTHLVEIPATRAAELTAWLGQRVGRDIVVPDLSDAGLTFAGGRMLVIDGRPAGELMYTRPNRPPIALCITESDRYGPMTPIRIDERGDLTLASWRHGGHDFVIVGEMGKAAARDLADRTRRQYAG